MYFESNRSSYEGSMAVGTVVMNRVESDRFPNTICGVVGQHRQFAQGVLTAPMDPKQMKTAVHAADTILKGGRYAPVGQAMHFHSVNYRNPYPAKYMTVAGGNAFYMKPGRRWQKEYTGSVATANATPVKDLYQRASTIVASGPGAAPCGSAGDAAHLARLRNRGSRALGRLPHAPQKWHRRKAATGKTRRRLDLLEARKRRSRYSPFTLLEIFVHDLVLVLAEASRSRAGTSAFRMACVVAFR